MATELKSGNGARAAKEAVHAHERKLHRGQRQTKLRVSKRASRRR